MDRKFKNSRQTAKSWEEEFYREGKTTKNFKSKDYTKKCKRKTKNKLDK